MAVSAANFDAINHVPVFYGAAKMFVGKDCALCKNPNWDTRSKQME